MTILARYHNQSVEVLDTWETGGVKMASVKALEGLPFIGGDKWPVRTEYTTAKIDELAGIVQDLQPESTQPSLLDLALKQVKQQWHTGETVWIWKGDHSGAYLKNLGGIVKLCLTDRQPACMIFILTEQGWETNHRINTDYVRWCEAVKS